MLTSTTLKRNVSKPAGYLWKGQTYFDFMEPQNLWLSNYSSETWKGKSVEAVLFLGKKNETKHMKKNAF
jgi:hypothetical protein